MLEGIGGEWDRDFSRLIGYYKSKIYRTVLNIRLKNRKIEAR